MLQQWNKCFLAVVLCFISSVAFASTYELGVHYFPLSDKAVNQSLVTQYKERAGKPIVVIEFFSFGCGACSHAEPQIEVMQKRLPSNVSFEQVPVVFHPQWETLAQAFYMLDLMPHEKVSLLKTAIFDAIHKDRRDASQMEVLKVIFTRQGISKEDFDAAYNSFSLMQKREYAKSLVKGFKVDEIPMVVVIGPQGAFFTKPSVKDGGQHFIDIVEHMIAVVNKKSATH